MEKFAQKNIMNDKQLNEEQRKKYRDSKEHWMQQKNRHTTWFNEEKEAAYKIENRTWGMPWTRMGYTYDYASETFDSTKPTGHFGMSEFCIKPRSEVKIKGIYSVDLYASKERYDEYKKNIKKQIKNDIERSLETIEQKPRRRFKEARSIQDFIGAKYNAYQTLKYLLHENKDILEITSVRDELEKKYSNEVETMKRQIKKLLNQFLEKTKKERGKKEVEEEKIEIVREKDEIIQSLRMKIERLSKKLKQLEKRQEKMEKLEKKLEIKERSKERIDKMREPKKGTTRDPDKSIDELEKALSDI